MRVLKFGTSEPDLSKPVTCAREGCNQPAFRWSVPLEHPDATVAAVYINACEEHALEWSVVLTRLDEIERG